ncbi:MATE family efflux transporter [bacterium 210820-DFI.6.37]|nr:MATE family efflux transporter [bacterium 210820-DFI.6.37]
MNKDASITKQGNPLGYAPIAGLIGKFAIPSIISMLVNAAYNITDQIFIGHVVGILGNAATNVAFPVVTFTTAFAQLSGIGTAANFNINLGAKREEEAKRFLGTGLTLMSILGLFIFCVIFFFKTPVLLLCGATETVLPYARLYLGVTAFGLPFLLFTSAGSNLIRADGSPTYSMICMVTGAVLNVGLDWLFLFVLDWGIQGAAAATVIGQVVSFALCFGYFFRFKTFQVRREMLGLRLYYVVRIAKLGTSNFINHTIMMLVNIVMNNTLARYGAMSIYGSDIPLAVSGVVAKLNSILAAFSVGLAQGCQPILGFNMGAGNYSRVKETYKKAVSSALIISILVFAAFQLFPRQITGIFGTGNELYFQFAERYLRIFMMMVCVYGVQPVSVNYFTGIGNTQQGILLSLSRQGLFLIPLMLILPDFFGLDGFLYAGPIADFMAFALSLTLVGFNFRKLTAAEKQNR